MKKKNGSKRICMIAYTRYATECRGRLEAEALVRMGHQVLFMVLKEGEKARTHMDGGVTVKELNVRKYRGKSSLQYAFSYLAFLCLAFAACTRMFLMRGIDVVHVHNLPDFLVLASLIPRLCGRPLILDVHDTVPETYLCKFETSSRLLFFILKLEERICCWLATRIVCVNHPQRDLLVARGIPASKIFTILSIPKFTSQKVATTGVQPSETFNLVYHGTISKRLGLDLAVEAVASLVTKIPGLRFHIYGSGDDEDEVRSRANTLGIADHVIFHGVVNWESLPEELKGMDAGIVANRRNIATELMLPAKLMDYVSLEIPAIAPRLMVIRYYFSDSMVSYFEPEQVSDMASAIFRVYSGSTARAKQAQAAKAFLEEYRWDKQKQCLQELYDETQEPFISVVDGKIPVKQSNLQP